MTDTKQKQALGLFSDISNDDYHKGPGISSTSLKHYIHAPRLYQAYDTGEKVFKATPTMDTGTAVHKLVLETDDFFSDIAIEPDCKKPTSSQLTAKKPAAKTVEQIEVWERFYEESQGKTTISPAQYDKARYMADAIFAHPEAQMLFKQGEAEQSGFYMDWDPDRCEGTHMLCKYRPDWRHQEYLVDIKTTRDASPDGFKRIINDLGYNVSASHYIAGDRMLKETNHRQFIFVCVEPEPPYLVAVYVLGEKSLQHGEWLRRKALDGIKMSRKEDFWPSYNNDLAINLDINNYLLYEMEQDGYYRNPLDYSEGN